MQIGIIVIYLVAIVAMMYFLAIKPQKKQQNQPEAYLRLAESDR